MGILLLACAEQEARKPIYRSNKKGLEQSIDRNKKINRQQQLLFEKVMEKDSLLEFNSSPIGYWYAYEKKHHLIFGQNEGTGSNLVIP